MKGRSPQIVDPKKSIDLFLKRYIEMWELPTIQKGFKASLKHHNDFIKNEITSELIEPDNEGLRALLTYWRKFVFDTLSPYRLDKIFDICRSLTDEDCKQRLGSARRHFNRIKNKRTGFNLPRNGKLLTPEEYVKIWLNGEIFHDNIDDVEFLASFNPAILDIYKFEFLSFVSKMLNVIRYVAHEVKNAKQNGWFQF